MYIYFLIRTNIIDISNIKNQIINNQYTNNKQPIHALLKIYFIRL